MPRHMHKAGPHSQAQERPAEPAPTITTSTSAFLSAGKWRREEQQASFSNLGGSCLQAEEGSERRGQEGSRRQGALGAGGPGE